MSSENKTKVDVLILNLIDRTDRVVRDYFSITAEPVFFITLREAYVTKLKS